MNAQALLASPGLPGVLAALPRARLVGGCVRDMLAGCAIADIDLATPDPPEATMAALAAAGLRAIPTGLAHGTVSALSAGHLFEITTLRRDDETDGRRAKVSWTGDFGQDAARRDFTINAMFLDRHGELHDYFDGAADLAAGRVRFVGEAGLRVAEDYLRILRFFRFFARYGRGAADSAAVGAIRAGLAGLGGLSVERVWSELKRILAAPDPRGAVALMGELGVLAAILPEGVDFSGLERLIALGAPANPMLRLAALLLGDAEVFADRLKLSNAERDYLVSVRQGSVPGWDADDTALRQALAEEPSVLLGDRLWLAGVGEGALRARIAGMARPVFPLEGRDALALGAAPGPGIGEALRAVRGWWLEGGCVASREVLVVRLAEALKV